MLEASRLVEIKKDRKIKELKEETDEGRRLLAEVRHDLKTIVSILSNTEEGRERLEKTQENLINRDKSCRTCHPWVEGSIELKSDFAKSVVK